jgi:23S rRNA pseudouridine1911/1915/1917 synthase
MYNNLSEVDGFYPGIVHRLDKDTTGLMVIAKNNHAHYSLAQQLQNRTMSRIYNALVFGIPNLDSGTIKTNIKRCSKNKIKMAVSRNSDEGKEAITHYKIIERFQEINLSLLELRLETGRTHQIRVHLSHNKNPIIGDKLYINSYHHNFNKINDDLSLKIKHFPRQALHAKSLYFIHPTNQKQLHFESELAPDIKDIINEVILITLK